MKLLALCTSGPVASAAIYAERALLSERFGPGGLTHSETIMPLCDALLLECGLTMQDIDVFAADTGPGSFTGVRIGVCAANAMAAAVGKGVMGISSLEALCFEKGGLACALLDARNGNGYAAVYDNGACVVAPSAVVIADFLPTLPKNILLLGEGAVLHAEEIRAVLPDCRIENASLRADAVGFAAWRTYHKGSRPEKEILPLYLRPSQAERLYKEK